ncbi:hypothetical protein [Mycoplasma crocodyli]|uniref:hypothetical protein n=1 Tax=Mycoplasma crocodyli TaxID=50052 RepID=UPI0002FAC0AB|nr:hypothetical protein [Mycoplasma crocodyli]
MPKKNIKEYAKYFKDIDTNNNINHIESVAYSLEYNPHRIINKYLEYLEFSPNEINELAEIPGYPENLEINKKICWLIDDYFAELVSNEVEHLINYLTITGELYYQNYRNNHLRDELILEKIFKLNNLKFTGEYINDYYPKNIFPEPIKIQAQAEFNILKTKIKKLQKETNNG